MQLAVQGIAHCILHTLVQINKTIVFYCSEHPFSRWYSRCLNSHRNTPRKQIMKIKLNRRGFTLIELLTAIVIVGILASVMIGRIMVAKDRAHITAAQSDVDHFRKALSVYSVDYGFFPDNVYNSPAALSGVLVDPVGNPYMITPDGANFGTFTYSAINAGEQYEIQVEALDQSHTVILATADGIALE